MKALHLFQAIIYLSFIYSARVHCQDTPTQENQIQEQPQSKEQATLEEDRSLKGNSFKSISCEMKPEELDRVLSDGSIKGYFDFDQFWAIHEVLRSKYPEYIGEKFKVGYTFEERPMEAFFMGEDLKPGEENYADKNLVLVTGLHHSREPLTVTMVVFLMVRVLKERGVCGVEDEAATSKWEEFFRTNLILFVPIVNIDSFKYIAGHWTGPDGADVLMIRKNRHVDPQCTLLDGGVDLNRNYDFHFGQDDRGSNPDPCSQDYRGTEPFSEPETRSVKDLVEGRPNIRTGVNMHSYGNAWIYPYNFVNDAKNLLLKHEKPKFYKFYREFSNEMRARKFKADFGNSKRTIDYTTNGEGGDWLTGREQVYDVDVELGSPDKSSESFYPAPSLIPRICRFNYLVFRELFWKHNVDLVLHRVTRNFRKRQVEMVIFNKSLSSLINFEMEVFPQFKGQADSPTEPASSSGSKVTGASGKAKSGDSGSKEPRTLKGDTPKVEIFYVVKVKGNDKVKDPEPAIGNKISDNFKGRYYLSIVLKFAEVADMKKFERVKALLTYNTGYEQEFLFYLNPK